LVLAGPIAIDRLNDLCDIKTIAETIYMTFGLHNCLIVINQEKDVNEFLSILEKEEINYEVWPIINNLVSYSSINRSKSTGTDTRLFIDNVEGYSDTIQISISEYLTIANSVLQRGSVYYHGEEAKIVSLHDNLCDILASNDYSTQIKQSYLLKTNAALSRFTSQKYSGIKPILSTECHFWYHSLFGVGIANVGLEKFVNFIRKNVSTLRLSSRLSQYSKLHSTRNYVDDCSNNHFNKGESFLENEFIEKNFDEINLNDPILPVVCYFSGRDGFHSDYIYVSAPTSSVANAGHKKSNLLTITHELTHIFIKPVLKLLIPQLDSDVAEISGFDYEKATKLFTEKHDSTLASIRHLFLHGVLSFYNYTLYDKNFYQEVSPDTICEAVHATSDEIEEIVVHVFDYLNFYNGDIDEYIKNIWATWGDLPDLKDHKLEEYLLRTLTCIQAHYMDKSGMFCIELFVKILQENLATNLIFKKLLELIKMLNITPDDMPETTETVLESMIRSTKPLAYFVKRILILKDIKSLLYSDGLIGKDYSAKTRNFLDGLKFDNPLEFLKEFSGENEVDESHSLWIYYNLAFNCTYDEAV
jgi:hypothetical protein